MSPDEVRATGGIRRVLVVVVAAVAGFVAAVVVVSDDARAVCVVDASPDASYQARLLGPLERSAYRIAITRDGRPVTGATVCASATMAGTATAAFAAQAEPAPGVYRVPLVVDAVGRWQDDVLIDEAGHRPVRVPLRVGTS